MVIASDDLDSAGGIRILDGDKWQIINSKDGIPDNRIWALAFETDGTIWAATGKGIAQIDPSGYVKIYTTLNSGLPFDYVTDLCITPKGELWVSTSNGVGRFITGK